MANHDEPVAQWVAQAKAGSEDAKTALYTHFHTYVTRVASLHKPANEDTEDITQEVFMRAFRALPGFREQSTFRTWITRIAINTSLMSGRYVSTHPLVRESDLDEESGEEMALRQALNKGPSPEEDIRVHELVETLCSDLSPTQRTALKLRYIEGKTPDEIVAATGRNLLCTKNDLHRGLVHAHNRLQNLEQHHTPPAPAQPRASLSDRILPLVLANAKKKQNRQLVQVAA